jgi:hypothetical protein
MILVVDDFFDNPEVEVVKALLANYQQYEGAPPNIALTDDPASLAKLNTLVGPVEYSLPPAYRFYKHQDLQPTYIHSDANEGDISVVVFLNKEHSGPNGLAFWRHETGATTETNNPIEWLAEGLDDTKWTMDRLVEMQFNRAVIFDSKLFHSRYPKNHWSTGFNNTRYIKVFFLRRLY